MPRRTEVYQKLPWTGGINNSVDSGVLPDNDLTIANNVQFSLSGSRLKREGLEYLDTDIPAVTNRASSGTTRTLTFGATINDGTDDIFVVGEKITIASTGSETKYTGTATITAVTATTISYIDPDAESLSEGTTATSTITVTRASSITMLHDYWRFSTNNAKEQLQLTATDDFQLFVFDSNNARTKVSPELQVTSIKTVADVWDSLQNKYFLIYDEDGSVGVWFDVSSGGSIPAGASAANRAIEVDIATNDTANTVASALQAALDGDSKFSASVASDVVTVIHQDEGTLTVAADVDTGFTISTTTTGAPVFSTALDQINAVTFTEKAIISFSGVGNAPIKYNPDTDANYQLLAGNPPDFSFGVVYLGRLWTNDKTNPDRVHYSTTGNSEEWGGTGDSGALDFTAGDGDPKGITAIWSFKNILFVAKRDSLYKVTGDAPENFAIELISSGIGCESQSSVVSVDERDVVWVSKRGVHSLSATIKYGDTEAQFISAKIQRSFNEHFSTGRLKYTQAKYIPRLNSVAFSMSVNLDGTDQNALYFYNVQIGEWYRWPNQKCPAVSSRVVGDNDKLLIGTDQGRIVQAQRGSYTDFSSTGITYQIKTGTIYPDGNPQTRKGFKRLYLFYKPLGGSFQFTVSVRIDNYGTQAFSFERNVDGDILGTSFTLGASVLGSDEVFAPFNVPLEGHGRGMTLEITQTGTGDQVEIYGFAIEYEIDDILPEVV